MHLFPKLPKSLYLDFIFSHQMSFQGVSISALLSLGITMWLAIGQRVENPYVSYLETNVANCSLNATDIKTIPTDP